MVSETDKKIIRLLFDDIINGRFPEFGSPETRCDKCMFAGIACEVLPEYVGCLCGWKMEAN